MNSQAQNFRPATLAARDFDKLPVITPNRQTLEAHGIVGFYKHDKRVRPFNLMRTRLSKRIDADNHKLVGIASAAPEAGKSFLALNLAAALARVSEERVILVDLDLRRGCIAEEIGFMPEDGVSDYLDGSVADIMSVGCNVEGTKLTIFPTRPINAESAELLSQPRFLDMIRFFREETGNALVVFDMPPAFANDDAMITMQELDAYVMIVECGKTNKKQLLTSLSMFDPTPCIGTILNKYRGGIVDASGYGYGYGYGKSSLYDRYY